MDPGTKDRLLRNITIAATAVTAALLLSADYGPRPHALSSISSSLQEIKDWFWSPSRSEQEELQRRALSRKPPSPSSDAENQ